VVLLLKLRKNQIKKGTCMGLEMYLPGPEGVRVNPTRDIAIFWPQLVQLAAQGLIEKNWEPWYRPFCEAMHVHEGHLLKALAAFTQAMEMARHPDVHTPLEALNLSGFLNLPWAAQLVCCAKIGQMSMGAWWAGYKSAFHVDETSPTVQTMAQAGLQLQQDLDRRWGTGD
jgi:hypothetical protein